ncbi:YbaY family lipoprotein [Vibrio gazogenes]|uniref:Lipo-like protein n=1 Tax=Vibrio gazogenes TaxID=687 RepID=A0A1Z2SCE9_VIBGA|nr:YbaY family lipoprotein [Vibrio gazogenes]ASA54850.1 hypothetical protein BSQ33_03320 [Vibrio gazogenes]
MMKPNNQWCLLLSLLCVFLSSAGQAHSQTQAHEPRIEHMTGTLLGDYPLPKNVFVVVTLNDQTQHDQVIAKYQFHGDGLTLPIDFQLAYSDSNIRPNHRYCIQAKIFERGNVRYFGTGMATELALEPSVYDGQIQMTAVKSASSH